ncbi:MAG: GH25 family lysozyme [Archangium sp.]|nr:GH25 family lysozyme [Archangium sp.]
MKRLAGPALVGLVVAGSVSWLLSRGGPPSHAVSKYPARFAVRGLDVSHHNGLIDWPRVAQSGVSFVYVKASEGGDVADARFAENLRGARAAGLKAGAYHFFTFCRPGEDQAKQFLSLVKMAPGDLPPAVDVEFVGNCRDRPSREVVRENLEQWLSLVEQALGRRPVIYSTPDAAAEFLGGLPHVLWLRQLPGEPQRPWAFWQFDPSGSIPGIAGPVDLDVFAGDRAALDAL